MFFACRWMRGSAGDQPQSHSSGQGSGMSPSKTTDNSSPPQPTSSSSMGRPGPMHPANARTSPTTPAIADPDPESDSDMVHPDQQNRTRQKKFVKNFKGLPIEETVHKRKFKLSDKLKDKKGSIDSIRRIFQNPQVAP